MNAFNKFLLIVTFIGPALVCADSTPTVGWETNPSKGEKGVQGKTAAPKFKLHNSKIKDARGQRCIEAYDNWLHQSFEWSRNIGLKFDRLHKQCADVTKDKLHHWATIKHDQCSVIKTYNYKVPGGTNLQNLIDLGNNASSCMQDNANYYLINDYEGYQVYSTIAINTAQEINPLIQVKWEEDEKSLREVFQFSGKYETFKLRK